MRTERTSLLKRAGAMLCAALVLVFTQAAVASAVGTVQHALVGHHGHQHMIFADISLDVAQQDEDHHHTDEQLHDEDASLDHDDDHGPGHHHHHGDLGTASLMLASAPPGLLLAWSETVNPVSGRLMTDTRHSLPDRPPRASLLRC